MPSALQRLSPGEFLILGVLLIVLSKLSASTPLEIAGAVGIALGLGRLRDAAGKP